MFFDRMLQQAVGQVLAIKFEMEFEDYSYGFRPNLNAQYAVLKDGLLDCQHVLL